MKIVIQRSLKSQVSVQNKIVGKIEHGLVILVAFKNGDTIEDIEYMIQKIIYLRIFEDEKHKMNQSIQEVNGQILSISQFTLYADTTNGRRPNFKDSLNREEAEILYHAFNDRLRQQNIIVETGIFGADMQVEITNDGPVTMIIESRDRFDKKQSGF